MHDSIEVTDDRGREDVAPRFTCRSAVSHRLGWDPLEYGKLTDEDRTTLWPPRVAAFFGGLLLILALF